MNKKRHRSYLAILLSSMMLVSLILCFHANNEYADVSNNMEIESLTEDEIDMERLKKMLLEPIWRYAYAAWQVGEYSIYCETAGLLQCPVPGLTK